jgi:hypothetical protein
VLTCFDAFNNGVNVPGGEHVRLALKQFDKLGKNDKMGIHWYDHRFICATCIALRRRNSNSREEWPATLRVCKSGHCAGLGTRQSRELFTATRAE